MLLFLCPPLEEVSRSAEVYTVKLSGTSKGIDLSKKHKNKYRHC